MMNGKQKCNIIWYGLICCSVTKSCLILRDPMDCSMPGSSVLHCLPTVCPNSCPLSQWCYLTILSSCPLLLCLQSLSTSGSFPVNQLFASGGQSIGASSSASVLPMNIQDWFPDRLDLLVVQGTHKCLLQHHNSKASVLRHSAFLMVQFSHLYMTTEKTIVSSLQKKKNHMLKF